jgi:hypothetical protein
MIQSCIPFLTNHFEYGRTVSIKLRDLQAIALLAVAKGEANLIALEVQETRAGSRHPVGIAAQITQGLLGTAKRGLGVDLLYLHF